MGTVILKVENLNVESEGNRILENLSFEMMIASIIFSLLIFLVINRIYPKMILVNISE